ncbi:uncharacterized protein LOC135389723 [Ornithodoros turicata]|uniref:uncharacterized protein LOC135389723 n=1 Tax=Ornithodoros turicata TaxID=34597 RepID=UPI0031387B6D
MPDPPQAAETAASGASALTKPQPLQFSGVSGVSLPVPSKFDFANPAEWPSWRAVFEDYAFASGIVRTQDETRVRTLLYCMGPQARPLLSSLGAEKPEESKYDDVINKLEGHFVHPANEIYESRRFHREVQQPGESVDAFYTRLGTMVKRCGYGSDATEDRLVRDRFVVGLRDDRLSDMLCRSAKLTSEEALLQARLHEDAEKERSCAAPTFDVSGTLLKRRDKFRMRRRDKSAQGRRASVEREDSPSCAFCGRAKHQRKDCPARKATCDFCGKQGHFAEVCRKRLSRRRGQKSDSVELSTISTRKAWFIDVDVNGYSVHFKVDSGAEVTVVPPSFPGCPDVLDALKSEFTAVGSYFLNVKGTFRATLSWRGRSVTETVYVVQNQLTPLLGFTAIESLDVVQFVGATSTRTAQGLGLTPEDSIFKGLGELQEQYRIRLRSDAQPFCLSTSRRLPLPLFNTVKQELLNLEQQGVIRKVDNPTEWCSGLVVVPKKTGGYRLCVDLTKLNKAVQRERYTLPTVEQILGQLSGAKVFSKLDATLSFHQVRLEPESEEFTTFITPFGRYCYRRLPFGIASAPEFFQRAMSRIVEGLPGVVCMIDDVLVFGVDKAEHDARLKSVIKRLNDAGVKLNFNKCKFGVPSVHFLGVIVSSTGIMRDPEKIKAIRALPPPQDVSGIRRLLGMLNHIGRFLPDLSTITAPIRLLLRKNTTWMWGPDQMIAFNRLKDVLGSDTCMAKYHPEYPTIVSADASSFGLRSVLLQRQPEGELRAVAFASRSLTQTEERYSQTEKECLAIVWAIQRFDQYLRGLSFLVETDHLPLIPLLGSKDLEMLPPRIQRMRIKIMRYQFDVKHVAGKLLATADTLSRAPCDSADKPAADSIELFISEVMSSVHLPSAITIDDFRQHQLQDSECSTVISFCKKGWPDRRKVPLGLLSYWSERAHLSVYNGLLIHNKQLAIPVSLRIDILSLLHEGHLRLRRCREKARESVWWPQCVSLPSTTSGQVITALKSCLARFGIPDVLRTDNGPQFCSSEFASFARSYGFRHETSSPRYPRSNGEAERMVRTVKDIMKKSDDVFLALLSYRNSPGPTGVSPAQLLMGRRLNTRLPVLPDTLDPTQPDHRAFKAKDASLKVKQTTYYNRRHRAAPLTSLTLGGEVWVSDLKCWGRVLSPAQRPRSFVVEVPTGTVQRNRHHLVPVTPSRVELPSGETSATNTSDVASPATFTRQDPTSPAMFTSHQPDAGQQVPEHSPIMTRYGHRVRPPKRLNL